jgi:hypothetical protein
MINIDDLADKLVAEITTFEFPEVTKLRHETKVEIFNIIADYLSDKCVIVWTIQDIHGIDPDISDEDAAEILGIIEENFDASIGVDWDTLHMAVKDFNETKKRTV